MVKNRGSIFIVITIIFGIIWPFNVYASGEDQIPIRLIATVSHQDEYEGLYHLGFLDTKALQTENIKEAEELVRPSVVKIAAGNYNGSGTIFELSESRMIIVSCRHLLQYDETPSITFSDQFSIEGNVIYLSDQTDLGFIEIKPQEIPMQTLRNCKKVVRHSDEEQSVKDGTELFHIGLGSQTLSDTYSGQVLDPWKFFPEFNTFMIHSRCKGEPGMSGGGTFDLKGYYLGMILGGKDDETASLPLSLIEEEWEKAFANIS